MTTIPFDDIHLHRIDAKRNMARFYLVTLEATLFGEIAIRRTWGRIGSRGQSRTDVSTGAEDAAALASHIGARKRQRGYRDVGSHMDRARDEEGGLGKPATSSAQTSLQN